MDAVADANTNTAINLKMYFFMVVIARYTDLKLANTMPDSSRR